jgi:uncharacterized protein (TIGR02996 family)
MPSAEQLALWAAIRANPDDDTPRLVYADWIQEHGDEARAEFIRVQCALAHIPWQQLEARRERGQLTARSEQLLAPNRRRWTDSLVRVVHDEPDRNNREAVKRVRQWWVGMQYPRGFAAPALDFAQAVRVIAAERELEPLNRVSLSDSSANLRAAELVAAVAEWAPNPISGMWLQGATDELIETLAAGRGLSRLDTVSFDRSPITDAGVRTLVRGPFLAGVRKLSLTHTQLGDGGAIALAGCPHLSGVVQLHLHDNRIGDAGAAALADSPHLDKVIWLTFNRNAIGPAGWRRLRDRFGGRLPVEE